MTTEPEILSQSAAVEFLLLRLLALMLMMRNLTDAARSLKIMADYLQRHPDALGRGKR